MKKTILIMLIALALVVPSFAQWRLDIGVDIPRGIGAVIGDSVSSSSDASAFLSSTFLPFPEASIYYTFGSDLLVAGLGVRCFTFILESVAWPNAFLEVNLGPVAIEAQVGGGAFIAFGLGNATEFGQVFFPDLSAWFKIGKAQIFRLGVGAIGLFLPETDLSTIPMVFYVGGKVALGL